jgi:hypothetical protein
LVSPYSNKEKKKKRKRTTERTKRGVLFWFDARRDLQPLAIFNEFLDGTPDERVSSIYQQNAVYTLCAYLKRDDTTDEQGQKREQKNELMRHCPQDRQRNGSRILTMTATTLPAMLCGQVCRRGSGLGKLQFVFLMNRGVGEM